MITKFLGLSIELQLEVMILSRVVVGSDEKDRNANFWRWLAAAKPCVSTGSTYLASACTSRSSVRVRQATHGTRPEAERNSGLSLGN